MSSDAKRELCPQTSSVFKCRRTSSVFHMPLDVNHVFTCPQTANMFYMSSDVKHMSSDVKHVFMSPNFNRVLYFLDIECVLREDVKMRMPPDFEMVLLRPWRFPKAYSITCIFSGFE